MTKLKFEELPPEVRAGVRGKHKEAADQLRARPGEWAVVEVYENPSTATSMAHAVRRGSLAAYKPRGAFDAASRRIKGKSHLYVRYVGEKSDE
jgi:hypothetical protein